MEITNVSILESKALVEQVTSEYKQLVMSVQDACTHKDVGETVVESAYSDYDRVCLHCGLFERKGGFGFRKLNNPLVYKLTPQQHRTLKKDVSWVVTR